MYLEINDCLLLLEVDGVHGVVALPGVEVELKDSKQRVIQKTMMM